MLILSFRVKVIEFVGDLNILKIIIETHRMREEEWGIRAIKNL